MLYIRIIRTMTTPTLRQYLDNRYTTTADWNLTGWGDRAWTGKYLVPEEEYELFLDLFHTHVFTKGLSCALTERHRAQSPILIDLDFKYPAGGPLIRKFTNEQIRNFVSAYAEVFHRFFEAPEEPLQFFVMLKPGPEADATHDQHKDGVHIVCPNVTMLPDIQYAIRAYLLQSGIIERIFGTTGNVAEPVSVFDISVIHRNNWFLYGAGKANKSYYKLVAIYSVQNEVLESEDISSWTPAALLKTLSIRRGHENATELVMQTEETVRAEWAQLIQRYGKRSKSVG
jgi:hypothetical protein